MSGGWTAFIASIASIISALGGIFLTYRKLMKQRDEEIKASAETKAAEETRIEMTLKMIQESVVRIENNQAEMVKDIKDIQRDSAAFGVKINDLERRMDAVETRLNN